MICGCSFLISSATAAESIHFRPSMPLVSLPCKIRSIRAPALFSPSALVSTARIYSLESSDSAVCCSASWTNSVITLSSCSRVTFFNVAMVAPIFCTSRGPRYLNTSAASDSPIDISRSAALLRPSAFIGHPVLDDRRDDSGVLTRDHARVVEIAFELGLVAFVTEQTHLGILFVFNLRFRHGRAVEHRQVVRCAERGRRCRRRERAAHRRLHHAEIQEQRHRTNPRILRELNRAR